MDRDMMASQDTPIVYANTSVHVPIDEDSTLILKIHDNLQPSAQVVVHIYFALGF